MVTLLLFSLGGEKTSGVFGRPFFWLRKSAVRLEFVMRTVAKGLVAGALAAADVILLCLRHIEFQRSKCRLFV